LKYAIAILIALVGGPVAFAQSIAQPASLKRTAILLDIEGLTDPDAARVLKWNDTSNEVEWAVDATGGGGGGDVDAFAADPSSNGNFSAAAWITDLGLGALYQPLDADLTAIAVLTSAADRLPYFTGSGTASLATFTTFGRSLADDADAAAGRATLGLVIGTDVAAYNAGLNLLGLLSDPNADRIPFWDDSASAYAWLTIGTGLDLTGTTLTATGGAGGAPDSATYITQTANGTLTNEQALGSLATGILKNTTTTGVLSIAVAGTDFVEPDADLTDLADGTLTGSKVSGAVTVSGGTVNNSVIGGTTPAAGTFTTLRGDSGVRVWDNGADAGGYLVYDDDTGWEVKTAENAADDLTVASEAYNATNWNSDNTVPTKNDVRDQIETLQPLDADLTDLADGTLSGSKVEAATTTNQGASELATAAEVTTGSDATRAITPDALRGSDAGKRFVELILVGSDTAVTTGNAKGEVFYRVPSELNGWNLVDAALAVGTVSSSGTPTVQVRRRRLTSATATSDADMLSTPLTIDASEFDSKDAAAARVIDTANDDVATGDQVYGDYDVAGTGTKGGTLLLVFQKP
jgi:hypothetical protein